jgi:hypothetical protein
MDFLSMAGGEAPVPATTIVFDEERITAIGTDSVPVPEVRPSSTSMGAQYFPA